MSIEFMSMMNQCDVFPRFTIIFPWKMDNRVVIYVGFLWWMIAIQFGECPWRDGDE